MAENFYIPPAMYEGYNFFAFLPTLFCVFMVSPEILHSLKYSN